MGRDTIKPWSGRSAARDAVSLLAASYAAATSPAARDPIFASLYPTARAVVSNAVANYRVRGYTHADLVQEGLLAVATGLMKYSPDAGSAKTFMFG